MQLWDKGTCKNGNDCEFDRPKDCRDFATSNCTRGKHCIYRHLVGQALVATSKTKHKPKTEQKKTAETSEAPSKRATKRAQSEVKKATAYAATSVEASEASKKD